MPCVLGCIPLQVYNFVRHSLHERDRRLHRPAPKSPRIDAAVKNGISALLAAMVTDCITNPLWVRVLQDAHRDLVLAVLLLPWSLLSLAAGTSGMLSHILGL